MVAVERRELIRAERLNPREGAANVRLRILESALDVFATKGFEATTIREITEGADANIAAVNYHFNSKAELFRAVLFHAVGPLNAARSEGLDRLLARQDGRVPELADVLRELLSPLIKSRRNARGNWILIRLLQQVRLSPSSTLLLAEQFDRVAQRYINVLSLAAPGLTRKQIVLRYEFVRGAAMQILGDLSEQSNRLSLLAEDSVTEDDDLLDELVLFATKGFVRSCDD